MFNFEPFMGGSIVQFKKQERPPETETERKLRLENSRNLGRGIDVLRRIRTQILLDTEIDQQQEQLVEAHRFCELMAREIWAKALESKPTDLSLEYLDSRQRLAHRYKNVDAGSGHGLPPQFSIGNLFKAADDMIVRLEENVGSVDQPNHPLDGEELGYVLQEFLMGTNDLTVDARNKLFDGQSRVGGILTGGGVYLELVKLVIDKYGDQSFSLNTFMIAVDKDNKIAKCETGEFDDVVKDVVITDDMIDGGGTMLTALWALGEYFPAATIRCGKGIDYPGEFVKRRDREFMVHLEGRFQDYADLSEEGKTDEALAIFDEAEQYAREHGVNLQAGWYSRKKKIEAGMFGPYKIKK